MSDTKKIDDYEIKHARNSLEPWPPIRDKCKKCDSRDTKKHCLTCDVFYEDEEGGEQ